MPRGPAASVNLTGERFGSLIAESPARTRSGRRGWVCRCDCGRRITVDQSNLKSGNTKSCGCMKSTMCSDANVTHRKSRTLVYGIWCRMIARCCNPKSSGFSSYGAKGITICDRWRQSFEAFLTDMGERPSTSHVIDRIDNSKGYSPENCRWADPKMSSRNRKGRTLLTAFGETKPLFDWLEDPRCAVSRHTLSDRINKLGWDHERAITTPGHHVN
jgi:hypothetical protein